MSNIVTNPADPPWHALTRAQRTIVVVDVVESVRLIEQHELDVIDRWRRFVNEVVTEVLPPHGGRLVKSLGDGMMLEFTEVLPAVRSSMEVQRRIGAYNVGRGFDSSLELRVGAHTADVFVDDLDIYGAGVNLAARLSTLARAGDIVVSANVRDHLVAGIDAEIEDLGDCHFKHLSHPARAYRLAPPGDVGVRRPRPPMPGELRPTLAVIPFAARSVDEGQRFVGDALADELIAALSKAPELNIISRLSTGAFRDRGGDFADMGAHLGADYVVSGSFSADGMRMRLTVELAETRTNHVAWAESFAADTRAVFTGDDDLIHNLVAAIGQAILQRELERAALQPLPTLQSYSLMLGAIALMHRQSRGDFDRARDLLEHLAERVRRSPVANAWLAKWHVLRVVQGWSPDPLVESETALECSDRALDADPDSSLALTMRGLVQAYLKKDLEAAALSYQSALQHNPNESLAWLFSGTLHAFHGDGAPAIEETGHARRLSPLDPMRYFYDALSASASIAAGRYDDAITSAEQSLRANRTHLSTYRSLAIAQSLSGKADQARLTVGQLLVLEPSFTVRAFLDRFPGRDAAPAYASKLAEALQEAGLPP